MNLYDFSNYLYDQNLASTKISLISADYFFFFNRINFISAG